MFTHRYARSYLVTAAVFLDMFWRDQLLNWDPRWTDGYDFFDIDHTLLWTPDLQLYNVVGSYKELMNTPALFLSSNGDAWWDAQGLISFSCVYDTSKFKFDSQQCTAVFGSWIYASYQMNISDTVAIVESSFENLAWEVTDVTAATSTSIQWNVDPYSFSSYTIKVQRYYNHYVSTAIVPSLLITYLTLLSLWIKDVNTRLSMGITGLLALVAVQVSAVLVLIFCCMIFPLLIVFVYHTYGVAYYIRYNTHHFVLHCCVVFAVDGILGAAGVQRRDLVGAAVQHLCVLHRSSVSAGLCAELPAGLPCGCQGDWH